MRHFDDRILNRPMVARDLRRLKRVMPQVQSLAGHGIRPHLDLHDSEPSLRYFTFLRDPIERAISCFQFVAATHPDYRDRPYSNSNLRQWFFEHIERDNNCHTWHLAGEENASLAIEILRQRVDFIGLVRSFDESLQMLQAWMHDYPLDIRYRSLNVSATRSGTSTKQANRMQRLREFGRTAKEDPELLGFVRAHNKSDCEVYNSAAKELYPAQCERLWTLVKGHNNAAEWEGDSRLFAIESRLRLLPSKLHRNLVLKPLKHWLFRAA